MECGKTKILCTASWQEQVPVWMKGRGGGWLTAEYSMLPGSTFPRKPRDGRTARGVDARSLEIQRLVGRSLRAAVNLDEMPEITIWVDCDVLSADGGTRTTAINGALVAVYDTLLFLEESRVIRKWPVRSLVAATSIGIIDQQVFVDLDYREDSSADVDMNLVIDENGHLIEVQGSAERSPFTMEQNVQMLEMGHAACQKILELQKKTLGI